MRSLDQIIVLILLVGAAGCQSTPPLLYVDLSKIESKELSSAIPPSFSKPTIKVPGPSQLSGREASDRRTASPELIEAAEERLRKSQERTFTELKRRLRSAFFAQAAASAKERTDALWEEHQKSLNEFYDGVRAKFDLLASKVGPMRTRIALLADFPDPDPAGLRTPPETDILARRRYDEAQTLRAEIQRLEEQFRLYLADNLADLRLGFRADQAQLEEIEAAQGAALEERADREAKESADRIVADWTLRTFNPRGIVAAQAESTLDPPILPAHITPQIPIQPRKQQLARQMLLEQAEIFARMNGGNLTLNPTRGRDITSEFVKWRKQNWDEL